MCQLLWLTVPYSLWTVLHYRTSLQQSVYCCPLSYINRTICQLLGRGIRVCNIWLVGTVPTTHYLWYTGPVFHHRHVSLSVHVVCVSVWCMKYTSNGDGPHNTTTLHAQQLLLPSITLSLLLAICYVVFGWSNKKNHFIMAVLLCILERLSVLELATVELI